MIFQILVGGIPQGCVSPELTCSQRLPGRWINVIVLQCHVEVRQVVVRGAMEVGTDIDVQYRVLNIVNMMG